MDLLKAMGLAALITLGLFMAIFWIIPIFTFLIIYVIIALIAYVIIKEDKNKNKDWPR